MNEKGLQDIATMHSIGSYHLGFLFDKTTHSLPTFRWRSDDSIADKR